VRRIKVLLAIAVACVSCAVGLVLASTSSAHPSKVGYPNFVCVSTPSFGFCIGPPTKQG
jgi:hypothetical protein